MDETIYFSTIDPLVCRLKTPEAVRYAARYPITLAINRTIAARAHEANPVSCL
jgi:hypothetical protein